MKLERIAYSKLDELDKRVSEKRYSMRFKSISEQWVMNRIYDRIQLEFCRRIKQAWKI